MPDTEDNQFPDSKIMQGAMHTLAPKDITWNVDQLGDLLNSLDREPGDKKTIVQIWQQIANVSAAGEQRGSNHADREWRNDIEDDRRHRAAREKRG